MTHALGQDCSLDILLSCPRIKGERGDETAIYHQGDIVSGFIKVLGHVNTVLDGLSVALEGEPK
jgi:hypothetical protein